MQLIFFDKNEQVCEAWRNEFADYEDVSVYEGKLEVVPEADCIVAAGNSFGIMDGGLDAAFKLQFPGVQDHVHDALAGAYFGEIPVGASVIVSTGHDDFRWLAYTPTMRYPRPIAAEVVYDATRAALIAIESWNDRTVADSVQFMSEEDIEDGKEPEIDPQMLINSVAIPGLGTGTGNVGARTAARMMRLAYESVYVRSPGKYENWEQVADHLNSLYGYKA